MNQNTCAPKAEGERLASEDLLAKLVQLRKERKIGQISVARAIGVTQGRLSQIESLKTGVSLEAVYQYARAIGSNLTISDEGAEIEGEQAAGD
ncbi:MAG: helix-turn-helix transcriptional regulator [Fimbriimonas sp.]|nr:helix-turn-helix transcriptional regulator [Fimbriimonas sp.]